MNVAGLVGALELTVPTIIVISRKEKATHAKPARLCTRAKLVGLLFLCSNWLIGSYSEPEVPVAGETELWRKRWDSSPRPPA
jgi:hypothetical protein